MSEFKFKDPDTGQIHTVTGPEGATEQQAFDVLQQRLGNVAAPEIPEDALHDPSLPPRGGRELTLWDDIVRANRGGGEALASGMASTILSPIDLAVKSMTPSARAAVMHGKKPDPSRITDPIRKTLGVKDPDDLSLPEAFLYGGGEVIIPGAGFGKFLATKAPALRRIAVEAPGRVKRFLAKHTAKVGESFEKNPLLFTAAEALPGGGGRVGSEFAEEKGAGPLGQAGVGLAAAVSVGAIPSLTVNIARRAGTAAMNTLREVLTDTGGMARAARQTQARVAGPVEDVLQRIDDAPPGVTAAQASEEPALLAQQAKALESDPVEAKRIADELLAARIKVQDDLKATFGDGTTPGDFQHSVVQSVAPAGVVVARGQTDEMLREVAKGFDEAYETVKGVPIRMGTETTPGKRLTDAIVPSAFGPLGVTASNTERMAMAELLEELAKEVEMQVVKRAGRQMPKHSVDSAHVLELRRRIRKMNRRKTRSGATGERAEAEAAILQSAERRLTAILDEQLPAAVRKTLRETDAQYAQYVTVLNAAGRGNGEFTVSQLQTAIRMTQSSARVARGEAGPLAVAAQQGGDLTRILGKPRDAARVVRGMEPEQIQATKGDFAKVMFDDPKVRVKVGEKPGISGSGMLEFLAKQKETMIALGFTPDDLARTDFIARRLRMMETTAPGAVKDLLEDKPGRLVDLAARIVGSIGLTKTVRRVTGSSSGGAGIIIAKAGSDNMRRIITSMTVDKASMLLREAVSNKELFKAMLVSSTDPIIKQIQAGRRINAFFLSVGLASADEAAFPDERGDDILNVEVE